MLASSHALLLERIKSLRASNPEIWESGDEVLIADMLEGESELHTIIGAIIKRAKIAEFDAKSTKELIQELRVRQDSLESSAEALRKLALDTLNHTGLRKLTVPGFNLTVIAGQPKVIITDPQLLPDHLVAIERKPYKVAIKLAIEQGSHVPGATLSNSDDYLMVKP